MAELTIPNVRQESTVLLHASLKDNGVAVDWSGLSDVRAFFYSDLQRVIAGRCEVAVGGSDSTVLDVLYAATRPQYLGVNRLLVRCTYQGREKTFDLPVVNFVERTAQATGVVTLVDPELSVTIEVSEVSTSLLDGAIAAALDAAEKAEKAAALVPLQVLEDCVEATGNAEAATASALDAAEAANAAGITSVQASVADNEPGTPSVEASLLNKVLSLVFHHLKGLKGDTGATPNITVGTVTTGAPGTPVVITMTGTTAAPVLNITIPQGMKGDQGNTGSSVAFPYELVNNLTTNDPEKGLSAAQGVVLDGKVSQLRREVAYADTVTGENILDPSTLVIDSKYIDRRDGTIASSSTAYGYTDFFLIPPEGLYINVGLTIGGNSRAAVVYYDENKDYIGFETTGRFYAQPGANRVYARFNLGAPANLPAGTNYAIFKGHADPGYVPFARTKELATPLKKRSIPVDALSFAKSKNLIKDVIVGYSIRESGDTYQQNANYDSTGLIYVKSSTTYVVNTNIHRAVVYKNTGVVSRVINSGLTIVTAADETMVILSFVATEDKKYQMEEGTTATAYEPYRIVIDKEALPYKFADNLTTDDPEQGLSASQGVVLNGKIGQLRQDVEELVGVSSKDMARRKYAEDLSADLVLDDYPFSNEFGDNFTFGCRVTSFSAVKICKGYETYRARWFEIDDTNIVLKKYGDSTTTVATVAHGLTISRMLNVNVNVTKDGTAQVTLQTLGGSFSHTFEGWDYYANGAVMAKNAGSTLTDCSLSATNPYLRCPVWLFGASYEGVEPNRYPGQLKAMGYFNYLLNGYAGRNGATTIADFRRALNYGTPKYLYYAGPNDPTDATYISNLGTLSALCAEHGITLIVYLRPDVPSSNYAARRAAVEALECRIVNAELALHDPAKVWSEGVDTWYDGFLATDGKHPTALGAKALAMQFLKDLPEVTL